MLEVGTLDVRVTAEQALDIVCAEDVPNTQHEWLERRDDLVLVVGREAN
jgi:hypothetical protein